MEFYKSRVYTAVNADELKVGSKCIFANDLRELTRLVSIEDTPQVLIEIEGENYTHRFRIAKADCMGDTLFALAYLIEPPDELKYKPFKTIEKAMEAISKHGGWIKKKSNGYQYIVIAKSPFSIRLFNGWFTLEEMFYDYVFADNDSPCGELVEE